MHLGYQTSFFLFLVKIVRIIFEFLRYMVSVGVKHQLLGCGCYLHHLNWCSSDEHGQAKSFCIIKHINIVIANNHHLRHLLPRNLSMTLPAFSSWQSGAPSFSRVENCSRFSAPAAKTDRTIFVHLNIPHQTTFALQPPLVLKPQQTGSLNPACI